MDEMTLELELPGFRFHPTEEELLNFYLKNIIFGKKLRCDIISLLNIYHHEPWELPGLAKIGEREWYFFVPRDRKHGNGGRPNRTTEHGFWKATGSDRKIVSLSDPKRVLGLKKTLVFYKGRAPRGSKTDWVMNEYRLPDACTPPKDIVLCKIYRKATSLKVLEQRAAMEEEMKAAIHALQQPSSPTTSTIDTTLSFCTQQHEDSLPQLITQQQQQHRHHNVVFKKEGDEEELIRIVDDDDDEKVRMNEEDSEEEAKKGCFSNSLHLPSEIEKLPDLLLPKPTMDWTQDPFWTQLRSPWLDNNFTPYANIMNF